MFTFTLHIHLAKTSGTGLLKSPLLVISVFRWLLNHFNIKIPYSDQSSPSLDNFDLQTHYNNNYIFKTPTALETSQSYGILVSMF